jgi:phosphate/sulfate permease
LIASACLAFFAPWLTPPIETSHRVVASEAGASIEALIVTPDYSSHLV